MKHALSVLIISSAMLGGCATHKAQNSNQARMNAKARADAQAEIAARNDIAAKAKVQMVGMSKEQVFACMGSPVTKAQEGETEVWSYVSGGGSIDTVRVMQNSVDASEQGTHNSVGAQAIRVRNCTVNIAMKKNLVTQVSYRIRNGSIANEGEQCAYSGKPCL